MNITNNKFIPDPNFLDKLKLDKIDNFVDQLTSSHTVERTRKHDVKQYRLLQIPGNLTHYTLQEIHRCGSENIPVNVEMAGSCFDLNVFLGLRSNLAIVLRKWHRKENLPA